MIGSSLYLETMIDHNQSGTVFLNIDLAIACFRLLSLLSAGHSEYRLSVTMHLLCYMLQYFEGAI